MSAAAHSFIEPPKKMNLTTTEIAQKIILFGEIICGIELYTYQYTFSLAIIKSVLVRDGMGPTALFSRQCGKTEAVALVAIACSVVLPGLGQAFPDDERVSPYARGFWTGIYAPKDRQAKLAFDRIRDYATRKDVQKDAIYADKALEIEISVSRGDTVSWNNGSFVLAETASDTTDNCGQTWHLLIIDEGQKVSTNKIKVELKPMLAATHGPMVIIGTASASKGEFYRKIESNVEEEREDGKQRHFQSDYQTVITQRRQKYEEEVQRYTAFQKATVTRQRTLLLENPHANKRPSKKHLMYERFIEDELRDLHGDVNDEAFKMNFRLLWMDNREIAIPEHIWNSLSIDSQEMNEVGVRGYLVAGLDVAKGTAENSDQTVLSIAFVDVEHPMIDEKAIIKPGIEPVKHYMKTVIGLYALRGDFEEIQYDGVIDILRQYPTLRYMVIDSTGIGDPVCARLKVLLPDIQIEGVSWNSSIMKNAVYKYFLMEIKTGRLRYAAGPETRATREFQDMQSQIKTLQKKFVGKSDLMLCEAEDGLHDDYPDSISLCMYAEKRSFEEEIPEPFEAESSNFHPSFSNNHTSHSSNRSDRYRGARRGRQRYMV